MTGSGLNIPRHWWGKIIGAIIGLFRGGIFGAVIGGLVGHFIDRFIAGIAGTRTAQETFFRALFSTLGHLGKADGRVTEVEIRMVESLMQRMQITGEDRQRAIRHFNAGKQPDFDLEAALRPFVQHSVVRHDLRLMFMEVVVEAAFSDGRLTEAEQSILIDVSRILKIPGQVFAAMLSARRSAGRGYWDGAGRAAGVQRESMDSAYAKLGLKRSATDKEVKRAYRKLVSQYHPDKLVSQGLPEEMMEMAKNRVRDINTAYDRIKQARGFK